MTLIVWIPTQSLTATVFKSLLILQDTYSRRSEWYSHIFFPRQNCLQHSMINNNPRHEPQPSLVPKPANHLSKISAAHSALHRESKSLEAYSDDLRRRPRPYIFTVAPSHSHTAFENSITYLYLRSQQWFFAPTTTKSTADPRHVFLLLQRLVNLMQLVCGLDNCERHPTMPWRGAFWKCSQNITRVSKKKRGRSVAR